LLLLSLFIAFYFLLWYCSGIVQRTLHIVFVTVLTILVSSIALLACLHDQTKVFFFGGPAFFQPIRAF